MGATPRAPISWHVLIGTLLCLLWTAGSARAELSFPALTGRVVDQAGILSAETQQKITEMSAEAEQRTGNQIVVATVKSLQGTTIEDYGYQLGRHWGIGQKGQNNGAILIVAPLERKVRIEVGYGLEGQLTDAQSKIIIENLIVPRFRGGDFDAGILAGTAGILQVITGQAVAIPEASPEDAGRQKTDDPLSAIFVIIFLLFFFGRGLFWPLLFMGSGLGRGGWGGGSGGGFSGGGFSGGGGSFGGGGASGSW
ncbi:MAG: TPM domain-containing protein [Rhodospirillaceae bacterium]|nr:MAG: TPM domain-containing protein [Rhodospirillaceae bacterium]